MMGFLGSQSYIFFGILVVVKIVLTNINAYAFFVIAIFKDLEVNGIALIADAIFDLPFADK